MFMGNKDFIFDEVCAISILLYIFLYMFMGNKACWISSHSVNINSRVLNVLSILSMHTNHIHPQKLYNIILKFILCGQLKIGTKNID